MAQIATACLMAAALWSACGGEPDDRAPAEATATPAPVATAGGTATPAVAVTAEATATARAAATAEDTPRTAHLTPAEIFDRVSPAIAFIETGMSTGSGILIEGGYVVTNAHVVWPYEAARVVLPDGSEFTAVPLRGWDLLADIAVLGPVDAAADAVALVDGEDLPIGSEVFLLGYPGEVEAFPKPTLSRGLLSRYREWEVLGITYLQTDAVAAGGQSGGALLSSMGEVIGMSGFNFTEGDFGLVASATDIHPRIEELIAGRDPSGLAARHVPLSGGERRYEVELANLWDEGIYVINEPMGAEVLIEWRGANDGALEVFDSSGVSILEVDDGYSGTEIGSITVDRYGPLFLRVFQFDEARGAFVLTSSHSVAPLYDPDDGQWVEVGQTLVGSVDAPGDIDYFMIALSAGERIEVTVSSILIDTTLIIDYEGAEDIEVDDDGGGGLFGTDSALVYRAPHAGTYFMVVGDLDLSGPGGYILTIE